MDTPNPETATAIRRVQWLTVGWMTIEVGIALVAALRARSVHLPRLEAIVQSSCFRRQLCWRVFIQRVE